jgi:CRP/FNR family cyclic AMP-dependent transcriptional regulator
MTPQEVEDLMEYATVRSYPRHSIIINEGDDSDSVYFIFSGLVKVFLSDNDGNEVIMATLKSGDYFGEMALEPGFRSASVMAVEPVSLAVVHMSEFRNFLRTHPDFVFSLLGKLIRRVRLVNRSLKGLALLDVYGRLAQLLNDLAESVEGKRMIVEPLTQQEMASRIGCSREMVSKILKDLTVGGYVEISRKSIQIKRPLPASW